MTKSVIVARCVSLLAGAAALLAAPLATAQPGDLANLQDVVTSGLSSPLYVCSPPGDDTRMFVVNQTGTIRLLTRPNRDSNWTLQAATFLDVSGLLTPNSGTVVNPRDRLDNQVNGTFNLVRGNEQGLLGLAFAPDYATSGIFYINYVANRRPGGVTPLRHSISTQNGTATVLGSTVIVRYRRAPANPNVADASSAFTIIEIEQPFTNHNGGCIKFGPDNLLYVGTGDGGSGNDPLNTALNPSNLLGKFLRLDVLGPDGLSNTGDEDQFPAEPFRNYRIPPGNPFAMGGGAPEVFMRGARNPWRWSFDRATGDLYIADVGQDVDEEVNFIPAGTGAGRNLGWRVREGNRTTGLSSGGFDVSNLTAPVYTYSHGSGALQGFSTTGGYVYRGTAIRAWRGRYFFADFVNRRMWSARIVNGAWTDFQDIYNAVNPSTSTSLRLQNVASFGEDAAGELYVVQLNGFIRKFVPQNPQPNPLDMNFDGSVDPDDLSDYIALFFASDLRADFNMDNTLDPDDLADYIAGYFAP